MRLLVDVNRAGMERIRLSGDLLNITVGDLSGPILTRMGQVHREQEREIFSTEGATGASGPWAPLSPIYLARKQQALSEGREVRSRPGFIARLFGAEGRKLKGKERIAAARALGRPISMKILVWSGDMKERFLRASRPEYVQRYVPQSERGGVMEFGAESDIASYHFSGNARLPQRDPVTKTDSQVRDLLRALVTWYREERVPQVLRAMKTARKTPPRGAA